MADVGGPIGSVMMLIADDEVTYNWFHNGRGTATLEDNADGWKQVREGYAQVLWLVAQGLAESKAEWTGAAADAAHGAVSPVRAWAEHALDSAMLAHATVTEQSIVFSETKARLSPPVAVPDKPWYNDFWPGDTNYDKALESKQANSLRNVELVRQYGDSTDANNAGYPLFDAPVEVTTDVSQRPEQPGQPVQPRDSGAVEWRSGPRQSGGPGDPGQPPQPGQPSTVADPGQPGAPPSQQVDPSQSVADGRTPVPVGAVPPVPGQDPAPVRNPVVGGPVAGIHGVPRAGSPDGSGGRVPVERDGGRPGGGAPGGQPGSGGRAGGGPVGEAVAGRGPQAGGVARGAGAGHPGGFVPGGGRAAGDEDTEHANRFGPVDDHEDFWDGGLPLVAPPVIGVDEEQ